MMKRTSKSARKLQKGFTVGECIRQIVITKGILNQQAAIRTMFSQVDASLSVLEQSSSSFLLNLPQKGLDHDVPKNVPLPLNPWPQGSMIRKLRKSF